LKGNRARHCWLEILPGGRGPVIKMPSKGRLSKKKEPYRRSAPKMKFGELSTMDVGKRQLMKQGGKKKDVSQPDQICAADRLGEEATTRGGNREHQH